MQDISPGNKYPYQPFYGGLGPRVSVAWNPEVKDGWLSKILGDKSTVFRAGYGRFFSRSLAAGLVSTSVLGDGFLQPVGCQNPNIVRSVHWNRHSDSGQCLPHRRGWDERASGCHHSNSARPGNAGLSMLPMRPWLSRWTKTGEPARTDQMDVSIQRQLKGNMILEVGYVGT